tara:strand:- start:1669 stop:2013 length:345 start_codon:yes stop_codon:yes gene_type:complete
MNFILWVFGAAFWAGAYFLGLYICKKFRKLKNNVNLVSIIIASLIAVPMVMQIKTKPITYAIGYSIVAPFLITTLVHLIYAGFKKKRNKSVFNDEFYFGYSGVLLMVYLFGLFI